MKLSELQDYLYSLLQDVSCTCETLKVDYCLAYGTLLGAIRHKAIIPWDDDIDLFVPREGYELLLRRYNQSSKNSFLYSIETCKDYHLPFAKIALNNTQSKESRPNWPKEMGVSIDIFPLDGLPTNKVLMGLHFYRMKFLNRCIGTYHYSFGLLSLKSKLLWVASHLIGYSNLVRLSKRTYAMYPYASATICGNLVWGSYHYKDVFKKELLGEYKRVAFSNMLQPVPEFPEALLTRWYGDYMQIPSAEEIEKCSHNFADLYEKC